MGLLKRVALVCLLACSSWAAVSSKLNIEEEDGSPSTFPYKLKVTNGALIDNGDGTASLTASGGGGSGPTGQINNGTTYQTPYYSVSGSSNVLSATSNLRVFPSSVTVPATLGLVTTYGVTGGSMTVNDLTANQMVRTDANKKLSSSATLTTTELAGTLQAAQMPALTGDVTTTAGSLATTLASVVTANQYGSATVVPVITFDAKGRITAVSSATVSGGGSGTVNLGTQYKAAYYSEAGSSTTVSASDHFSIFTDSVTLNGNGLRMTGRNLFLGYNAGGTFADYGNGMNIGIGSDALRRLTAGTGYGNVAIGQIAGEFITTGANNVALGNGAGPDIATGTGNICIGSNDNVSSVQSCQGIVEGSSNTMVGTGSGGYTGSEYSGDSGNTFIGYGAGSALATNSIAIGYKARVSGSYQAQIGGTGADGVTLNVSTITASSMTISGQIQAGTFRGAGLTTCGSSNQAVSYSATTGLYGCQTLSTGGSGGGSIVNTAAQYALPYYSVAGTSNTLSGAANLSFDDSISALVVGGGSRVDNGAITVNGNGSQTNLLHLNGTANQFINFAVSAASKGQYGVAFDGSNYYHRWRDSATGSDQMTLYTSGSNAGKLSVLGAPGLSVTYGISGGSGTFTTSLTVAGQNVCQENGTNCPVASGGASSLAVGVGTVAGYTNLVASPTAGVNFNSSKFSVQLAGSATAYVDLLNAVTMSSFTATQPILYNNATGAFSATPISLSTGAVGTLQAAQMPALTGDITTSGGSLATTLASVVTANQYGSATVVPVITFDAKGRITAVSSATITGGSGDAVLSATQTFSGANTFSSTVNISSVATITALVLGTTNYAAYGSSGTITPDATMGNNISITLTSSATINVPINAQDFQMFRYRIIQDAAGSRAVTLGSGFAFGTDVSSATFSTAANKIDYLACIYNTASSKCHVVSPAIRGY